MEKINISSKDKDEAIDITQEVESIVEKKGVKEGICVVYSPHTTAGITINENADPSVKEDLLKKLNDFIPENDDYSHGEGNSEAHIRASVMGNSRTIIIENGKLSLGTWEGVFFCEFDGPRGRNVKVKVIEG